MVREVWHDNEYRRGWGWDGPEGDETRKREFRTFRWTSPGEGPGKGRGFGTSRGVWVEGPDRLFRESVDLVGGRT